MTIHVVIGQERRLVLFIAAVVVAVVHILILNPMKWTITVISLLRNSTSKERTLVPASSKIPERIKVGRLVCVVSWEWEHVYVYSKLL